MRLHRLDAPQVRQAPALHRQELRLPLLLLTTSLQALRLRQRHARPAPPRQRHARTTILRLHHVRPVPPLRQRLRQALLHHARTALQQAVRPLQLHRPAVREAARPLPPRLQARCVVQLLPHQARHHRLTAALPERLHRSRLLRTAARLLQVLPAAMQT